jgi:hypothetical protein
MSLIDCPCAGEVAEDEELEHSDSQDSDDSELVAEREADAERFIAKYQLQLVPGRAYRDARRPCCLLHWS